MRRPACMPCSGVIIHQEEASVVRRIFTDYLHGRSAPEIARSLNDAGIPAPRGGRWTVTSIMQILRNEKYAGDITLARNVGECQKYVEMLTEYGVTVIFERESLRTDQPACSFALALIGAVSQDESHSISMNVAMAYRERHRRGQYNLGSNRILGYSCVDGRLVPDDGARIVRQIFTMFAGGAGYSAICRALNEAGCRTLRGNRFTPEAVKYILHNETYAGDKHLGKTPPRDYLTHKKSPGTRPETWYIKDDHEAIISRELWEACQERMRKGVDFQQSHACSITHV